MATFLPTHEITLTDKRDGARMVFAVALIDGAAYTREEWESADWESELRARSRYVTFENDFAWAEPKRDALYPSGCWLGTTTETPPQWEVSNGPPGQRSHAASFGTASEAVDYARALHVPVHFDEDFLMGKPACAGTE